MYIPSMPPRDNRPAGDRCEVTLRDTFAAAALTGLTANGDYSVEATPILAYRMADAMLRERERTNHDAAPAARASVGRPRTDKADLPTRCGTGDKPVTEPLPVFASGSGSVTPVSYEKSDEKRVFYDTKSPRNGALSGCESVQTATNLDAAPVIRKPAAYIVEVDGIGSIMPLCRDTVEVDGVRSRFADRVRKIIPLYAWNEWDEIRKAGDRVAREEGFKVMEMELNALHAENAKLRWRLAAAEIGQEK